MFLITHHCIVRDFFLINIKRYYNRDNINLTSICFYLQKNTPTKKSTKKNNDKH